MPPAFTGALVTTLWAVDRRNRPRRARRVEVGGRDVAHPRIELLHPVRGESVAQQVRVVFDRRGEVSAPASFAIQFAEDEAPETFRVGSGGVVE